MSVANGQTWHNELGSKMVITSYDTETGVFSGNYQSAVGEATKWYVMTGRADTAGNTLGWTVNWQNSYQNAHSATSWSGQVQTDESGDLVMPTTWLLTSQTSPEDNWESTLVGFDYFTQTEPTKETIAQAKCRCRKSHPKVA